MRGTSSRARSASTPDATWLTGWGLLWNRRSPCGRVHLLMYTAIEHACRNGYSWFDFNPSGGHEDVAAFKKGFGTVPLSAPMIVAQSRASSVLSAAPRLVS